MRGISFFLLFLISHSSFAVNFVCGADLNSDGDISGPDEYQSCVKKGKETLVDPIMGCENGFSLIGGKCIKELSSPSSPRCADGAFNASSGKCEKTIVFSQSSECPSGYSDIGNNQCSKTITISQEPQCPVGVFNSTTKKCETTTTVSKIEQCPNGYTNNGAGKCSLTNTATPSISCSSGSFNASTKKCETTTYAAKVASCPTGSADNGSGMCVTKDYQDKQPTCAAGYTYTNGSCQKNQYYTPNSSCPSGYQPDGNGGCVKYAFIDKVPNCSAGSYFQDGVCKTDPIYQSGSASCQYDYATKSGGTSLVYHINKPAQNQTWTQAPTNNITYYNQQFTISMKDNGATCQLLKSGNFGGAIIADIPITLVCPSGYSQSGAQCVKPGTVSNPIWVCPSGYTADGSQCKKVLDYTSSMILSCPTGTLTGSQCVVTSTQPPTMTCPSGYADNGSNCVKTVSSVPVVVSCPSGYVDNGSNCSKTDSSDPIYNCPGGYTGGNGTCQQVIIIDPFYVCPDGAINNGATCLNTSLSEPNWICPNGYISQNNSCTQTITVSANFYCPDGSTTTGSSCSKIVYSEPDWICPDGYTKSGAICVFKQTIDVKYSCEPGQSLNLTAPTCQAGTYNYQFKTCQIEIENSPATTGSCDNIPRETLQEGKFYPSYQNGSCVLFSTKFRNAPPTTKPMCAQNKEEFYCPIKANQDCLNNNGGSSCSPNQCVDIDTEKPINDGSIDGSMLVDDGKKNSDGQCLDQMYIFNGRGQDCKLAGVSTAFKDCCKSTGKVLTDQAGSYMSAAQTISTIKNIYGAADKAYTAYNAAIATGQSAAAAANAGAAAAQNYMVAAFDPTSLAISVAVYVVMEYVMKACDQTSMETAMLNDSGYCHYVGKYCAKRIKFIGCVQKAKSFCCFNSKLARIIHEQGRPQLSTGLNNWGAPEKPLCRGFTPEEFQSVDFGQIDLGEYIDEIQKNAQSEIQKTMENATGEFIKETN